MHRLGMEVCPQNILMLQYNAMLQHKDEGVQFHEAIMLPCVYVDASNKDDPHDGKTRYGYTGTINWGARAPSLLKCPSSAVAIVACPFLSDSLLMSFHALARPRAITKAMYQFLAIDTSFSCAY